MVETVGLTTLLVPLTGPTPLISRLVGLPVTLHESVTASPGVATVLGVAVNDVMLGTPPPGSDTTYISPTLGRDDSIIQSGYNIQMTATPYALAPASCNGLAIGEAAQGFKAGADPLEPTNKRYFALNSNGQIWEDNAEMFSGMPEVGEPTQGRILR